MSFSWIQSLFGALWCCFTSSELDWHHALPPRVPLSHFVSPFLRISSLWTLTQGPCVPQVLPNELTPRYFHGILHFSAMVLSARRYYER